MIGKQEKIDGQNMSQLYSDLTKRNKIISFEQTVKHVENRCRGVAGFGMTYDDFKALCREIWKEEYYFSS